MADASPPDIPHAWLPAWGLGSVAAGAASLLVPLYVVQLGGTPFDLGLLGAVAAFIGAPGAVLWGRLADETTNPRVVVAASFVGVGLVLAIVPFTASIPLLVGLNALLWLAVAVAGPVLTLLVVADVSEDAWHHEIALLNTYQGYGWATGLLLGIVWTATVGARWTTLATQRSLFGVCAVAAVLAAVLLARWIPAPTERQLEDVDPRHVARLLTAGRRSIRGATFVFNPNRLYWSTRSVHPDHLAERFTPTLATYFIGVVLFFTGFSAFFAPLPLYLDGIGFSSDLVFGLYLISSLGTAAFYTPAGTLSGQFDLRTLQAGALGLRGVLIPLVAVVGTVVTVGFAGTVITGVLFLGIGLTWSVIAVTAGTIVTRVAPPAVRGEALGTYAALSALAGGLGSFSGGALATTAGYGVAFRAAGAVVLLSAALIMALRGLSSRTGTTNEPRPPADDTNDSTER